MTEDEKARLETLLAHETLDYTIGERTVRDFLLDAIEAGPLRINANGRLEFADAENNLVNWSVIPNGRGTAAPCLFAKRVMFNYVYDRSRIPHCCRNCFKVKVRPKTVQNLKILHDAAHRLPCASKWGPEFDYAYSQDHYGGYMYAISLAHAAEIRRSLRALVAELFGDEDYFEVTIKRGCSEYEFRLGPSDAWEIDPELEAVEAYLFENFESLYLENGTLPLFPAIFVNWLYDAYMIGDESYRAFTGGKALFPDMVTYDPEA